MNTYLSHNTEKLFLVCSRAGADERLITKGRDLIKRGIDSDLFMKAVLGSAMPLIFYNSLKRLDCPGSIGQEFINNLKFAYLRATSIASWQYKETMSIIKLFSRNGIFTAPLKGPILSKRLYGDIAARGISVDMDFFVKWKDREKAHSVLIENGYKILSSKDSKKRYWQEAWSRPQSCYIDIIYDIWLGGYRKEAVAGLWDGARMVTDPDSGAVYCELKEEELLIYLAAHLVTSVDWYNLKYVCDINEFLNRYGDTLNWDSVTDKAKKWRLPAALYTALILNRNLFGSRIPRHVTDKIKPPFPQRILIRTFFNRKVMLKGGVRRALMTDLLNYKFFALIEARSLRDYLLFFKIALFPPQEVMLGRSYLSRILKRLSKILNRCRGYNKP